MPIENRPETRHRLELLILCTRLAVSCQRAAAAASTTKYAIALAEADPPVIGFAQSLGHFGSLIRVVKNPDQHADE